MVRLPVRGTTLSMPRRKEVALRTVLVELCPDADASKLNFDDYHRRLGQMIGRWSAEQARLDTSPLMKSLAEIRRDLERISDILGAHDEGIHEIHDIEVVSHLTSLLTANPEIGSPSEAGKLIDRFRRDATTLAQACLVSEQELKRVVGKHGRPREAWYDDFTKLLLDIADAAGVKPSLSKDRISGERVGWLMDAAEALETFLEPLAKQRGTRDPLRSLPEGPQATSAKTPL